MTARMYRINARALELKPKTVAGLKGQAGIVWKGLAAADGPVLAKDLATKLEFPGSKQDPYRVTLYYILVFKSKGLVDAVEPVREVEPEQTEEQLEETISAS